eukprot:CAMPEP_0181133600 /NCGR_PEP_ID=MMETSP1071-20121207/31614_1 /TAXON_ID=35127 /ORGANISM="Thalassiosira sp., Strain NH16" /LENGTH=391 /DNA_ID=CAMNT_0023220009 /DNA_START=1 /DNA_END=1177 /DNA_ORIENTATION=-
MMNVAAKKDSHALQRKREEVPDKKGEIAYPRRNLDQLLHCPAITYFCAIGALPSPPDDIDGEVGNASNFSKRVPNQRPEQCPRSFSSRALGSSDQKYINNYDLDGTMGYHRGMKVLTVGDGDFTFSTAVARLVIGDGNSKTGSSDGMVVATSYEDSQTLHKVYPDFDDTLESLKSRGEGNVIIGYNVDATRLDQTLPQEVKSLQHTFRKNKEGIKFHRVCWNFPCTAIGGGQDGQNDAMEQNKELVRKFVVNALPYLDDECGEIHMAHKTKPPYNSWGLEKVALEGIERNNDTACKFGREFEFKGRIAFDKCTLPPYTPRKALDRKSFPCHDACIFIFGWKGKVKDSSKPFKPKLAGNKFSATIPEHQTEDSNKKTPNPSSIIPVTEEVFT